MNQAQPPLIPIFDPEPPNEGATFDANGAYALALKSRPDPYGFHDPILWAPSTTSAPLLAAPVERQAFNPADDFHVSATALLHLLLSACDKLATERADRLGCGDLDGPSRYAARRALAGADALRDPPIEPLRYAPKAPYMRALRALDVEFRELCGWREGLRRHGLKSAAALPSWALAEPTTAAVERLLVYVAARLGMGPTPWTPDEFKPPSGGLTPSIPLSLIAADAQAQQAFAPQTPQAVAEAVARNPDRYATPHDLSVPRSGDGFPHMTWGEHVAGVWHVRPGFHDREKRAERALALLTTAPTPEAIEEATKPLALAQPAASTYGEAVRANYHAPAARKARWRDRMAREDESQWA